MASIPFASRTEVIVDLQHKFSFDATFRNVHNHSDCELKFFSEVFSLIDSMRKVEILHSFSQQLKKTNGVMTCSQIIQLLKDHGVLEYSETITEDEGFHFLVDNLYLILRKIINSDGFVSCMHTSSLGCIAWEIGELYLERQEEEERDLDEDAENNNNLRMKPTTTNSWKEKAHAWHNLSENLQELAKHQHSHMNIHHDFQKSNYAGDPRTTSVYGSTFILVVLGFFFMIIRNCKIAEAREFTHLLGK